MTGIIVGTVGKKAKCYKSWKSGRTLTFLLASLLSAPCHPLSKRGGILPSFLVLGPLR